MQQLASSPINAPHIALPLQHETMENTPERKGKRKKAIPSNTLHAGRTNEFVCRQAVRHCDPNQHSSTQTEAQKQWHVDGQPSET